MTVYRLILVGMTKLYEISVTTCVPAEADGCFAGDGDVETVERTVREGEGGEDIAVLDNVDGVSIPAVAVAVGTDNGDEAAAAGKVGGSGDSGGTGGVTSATNGGDGEEVGGLGLEARDGDCLIA